MRLCLIADMPIKRMEERREKPSLKQDIMLLLLFDALKAINNSPQIMLVVSIGLD
jgi:hypothetical protein